MMMTMLMMLLADDDVMMLMMLMFTLSGDKEALLLPSASLILIIRSESVKWEEERRSLRINDHFVSFPFLHNIMGMMESGSSLGTWLRHIEVKIHWCIIYHFHS